MVRGRCAACKYLKKKCSPDCIFSPYFPSNDPQRFACVHKIYGASNVGKILKRVPGDMREAAAESLYYEAQCRIEDSVYGCVKIIYHLYQKLQSLQRQIATARARLALVYYNQLSRSAPPIQLKPTTSFAANLLPQQDQDQDQDATTLPLPSPPPPGFPSHKE